MSNIIYKYHKRIDNALHKAAFRGKVDKINLLLKSISPYKTTSDWQTPLHLSLSKGHEDAANIFLNILEIDMTAAKRFLEEHEVNVESNKENFVFALGNRQIEKVQENCSQMILNPVEQNLSGGRCLLILIKENIYSVPEVLALRAKNEDQKFTLLSTIFDLMKENGVISLNVQRLFDHSTALHLAASRGLTVLVMKLLKLGGNPYLKDNAHQTVMGAAHSMGEFPTYVAMCRHLNLNMFETKGVVRLPISNAVWENVEFMIETLVTLRIEEFQESRDKAIRSVLSMNEIAETFLLANNGEKCLDKYGHLMSEKKLSKIIMLLVNVGEEKSDIVMRFIKRDYTIVKEKTNRVIQYRAHNTVLHSLVRNGWNDEVREIYREFPRLKSLLFEHKEIGLSALIQCIQCNFVDLAQFLIEEHEDEINRAEHWSQLLIAVSELTGSMDLMKMILDLPMTDPNLVLHGDQYTHTNALFVCIQRGNLEKVEAILASDKLTDLNIIKGKFDVTLLQSAIYSTTSSAVSSNFYDYHMRPSDQFKNLTNDLDTSEDEEEASDQPRPDTSNTNHLNTARYVTMNEIFDKLMENGANFKHTDSSHQTLLHHAVNRSNKYVVEKLLRLGLEPIDPDRHGNLPIHYVTDTEIFDLLRNHKTFPQTLKTLNKNGETVLHMCVRSKHISSDLCSKLIENGIDINALDHLDNTPLHNSVVVQSVAVCEFLINCNANVNLKNKSGQTPTHIALTMGNFEVAAVLLKQPAMDLFTLTNSGKSYLTMLSSLTDDYFDKIKESLEGRKAELDRLVELYCNESDDNGVSNLYHSINNKYLQQLLIAQPHIQVNVAESKHNDLLLHAVNGDVELARFYVKNGLDVNKINAQMRTSLLEALSVNQDDDIEVVKFLIEAGANVNYVGWQGVTPLHVACVYFNLKSIRMLLEAGADCNARDNDGKTPFERLPFEYRSIIDDAIA